ncbi:UDP-N-acetylmuramoyl-tripeptide--D-alanyl-D-alanine ligase [uncultured Parasutterella sp.]|uniref:UDP-N-acetylmuramoyl-tripeptide--D-alanyl-D- alanine ligase n=1 Tax=uncultured Parasutterella sp. TaxID=1263098 RepID=UPI0025B6A78A|nr:UDP-N-acetylmuramoyl-tripeptide--D-alanyl-D-alanine ligase [uncultured Parasutterella sp.]
MNEALMTIGELAEMLGAKESLRGSPAVKFSSVHFDSRKIEPNGLFFAIKGENDGHEYVQNAADAGAAAAVVDHYVPVSIPQLLVKDTRAALLKSAAGWRQRFNIPVIAVAGSNGKTTTTQMILSILKNRYEPGTWVGTEGNLNNDLGVPLMLWRLRKEHEIAAFEVGMNHIGEMKPLVQAVSPTIGTVTNTMRDHQEFLASLSETAKENGEVFAQLPRQGVAVINATDPFAIEWRKMAGNHRVVTFGTEDSDVYAIPKSEDEFLLVTPVGRISIKLKVRGAHNFMNAVNASAVLFALGRDLVDIKNGLEKFEPVRHRGESCVLEDGTVLIDDSYNANPDSMLAAVRLLSQYPQKKIFVAGDMGELGAQSPQFHKELGEVIRNAGIAHFFCVGNRMMDAAEGYGEGARHFDSIEELEEGLREEIVKEPCVVLFKASNFMKLYQLADRIRQNPPRKEGA